MNKLLDILLPRFLTEDVALRDNGDHLVIVCPMAEVRPGERFEAVATMRVLNLFGQALFPRMIGGPRPWPTPAAHPGEPQSLPPCPFCEGPPMIAVENLFDPNALVYRKPDYGSKGIEIAAYVFCHECGAQGPQHEGSIVDEADYLNAEAAAAMLWTDRTPKHRDLYDDSAVAGITAQPRRETQE